MVDTWSLAAFAVTAFLLIVVPGPSVLFVISRGVALGRKVMDSCWGLAAGTARAWLAGRPHRLERLGGAGGLVIIGLGARLALTGRKD